MAPLPTKLRRIAGRPLSLTPGILNMKREPSKSTLARDRAYGPPSAMRRRTDWGLNTFPHAAALHEAQAIECLVGNWPEAGAMGLRFKLADYIQTGNEVDAARLTRQLVRHLRANGRIAEAA